MACRIFYLQFKLCELVAFLNLNWIHFALHSSSLLLLLLLVLLCSDLIGKVASLIRDFSRLESDTECAKNQNNGVNNSKSSSN
jgi:hypothetical protein